MGPSFEISDRESWRCPVHVLLRKKTLTPRGENSEQEMSGHWLHHEISKEFHFGSFTTPSQDILDFFFLSY